MRASLLAGFLLPAVAGCRGDKDAAADTALDSSAATADTADTADTSAGDTVDSAPPDSADSSSDTASGRDVSWAGFGEDADLRITACGSLLQEAPVLAPGPDLDGDGVGEVAVGLPAADGAFEDQGAVLLFSSSQLTAGSVTASMARATVSLVDATGATIPRTGFGQGARWVGDRDGDGIDDLWTAHAIVSGARLAAGGAFTVTTSLDGDAVAFARWDDLDGDGRADWIFGFPERGMGGASGARGALGPVNDIDFDGAGTPALSHEVVGYDALASAGAVLEVLDADLDGDGVREVASVLGDDVVVLGSASLLGGATYAEEAVLLRVTGARGEVVTLGDVDGGGVDDLAVLQEDDRFCVAAGESLSREGTSPTCDVVLGVGALAHGDDLDGDGASELWVTRTDGTGAMDVAALDGADLLAGVVTEHARAVLPRGVGAPGLVVANGRAFVGRRSRSSWRPEPLAWSLRERAGVSSADLRTLLLGGDVAIPSDPQWMDLDEDGLPELVLRDEGDLVPDDDGAVRLHVFRGNGLAAGGARSLCDADAVLTPSLGGVPMRVGIFGDVDGDGMDDALLSGLPGDDGLTGHAVVSARQLFSAREDEATVRFPGPPLASLRCDLTGDGVPELWRARDLPTDGTEPANLLVLDPARFRPEDGTDAERGALPDHHGGGDGCLKAAAGTGDVLLTQLDPLDGYLAWRGGDLVVGELRPQDAAWAVLPGVSSTAPYWGNVHPAIWSPWLAPVTVAEIVTGRDGGAEVVLPCLVAGSAFAGGGPRGAGDTAMTCGAAFVGEIVAAWPANVLGRDDVPDGVALVEDRAAGRVLRAWDGVTGASVDLAALPSDGEVLGAGSFPDLLAAGGPGAWRRVRQEGGGRPVLELSFGR